ncbi:MAG: HNH endonuclease signature motif containing protein [Acidimicrobiia bacterium]
MVQRTCEAGLVTILKRLLLKVRRDPNGCWLWTGNLANGYGRFWLGGKTQPAHRVAYEELVGPVPDGLELDHLCFNKSCINPWHLEAVTHAENVRRSDVALGIRSAATHCAQGHEYTPENTIPRHRNGAIHRRCRQCTNRWMANVNANARRRKRAAAAS